MSEESIIEAVNNLQIERTLVPKDECLLFNPKGAQAWVRDKFDEVPRYLFRVTSPDAVCTTDECWVKSKDASVEEPGARVECFS